MNRQAGRRLVDLDRLPPETFRAAVEYLDGALRECQLVLVAEGQGHHNDPALAAVAAAPDETAMTNVVVVGTVLGDALFAGLRRIAQEAESFRRFPLPEGTPAPGAVTTNTMNTTNPEDC